MMKYLGLLGVVFLLNSCSKQFDGLTNFTVEYTQEVTVQSSAGINLPFNINTPPVPSGAETRFKNENTRKDLIKHIYLDELTITITSPSDGDFTFLEDISIYLVADGEGETKIAWKEPVPSSAGKKVVLDVSAEDLQRFIVQDEFSLKVEITTDKVLAKDHTFEIFSKFDVSAKLLN